MEPGTTSALFGKKKYFTIGYRRKHAKKKTPAGRTRRQAAIVTRRVHREIPAAAYRVEIKAYRVEIKAGFEEITRFLKF